MKTGKIILRVFLWLLVAIVVYDIIAFYHNQNESLKGRLYNLTRPIIREENGTASQSAQDQYQLKIWPQLTPVSVIMDFYSSGTGL